VEVALRFANHFLAAAVAEDIDWFIIGRFSAAEAVSERIDDALRDGVCFDFGVFCALL
jgi:hypothetical protein